MKPKYQPQQFEQGMTELWQKEGIHSTDRPSFAKATAGKMYTLVMFPYPSGAGLHVGHVRVYTGTDVLARYYRMNGYSVLDPMGWDAFGLPAENAAIKEKKNPIDIVPRNIATFKGQMIKVGMSFDWDREFSTTDPSYYKWTQYLFIQFYKMGLLYKKMTSVYFCEFCKTGLAEEEVLPNGTHERCGNTIVRKDLPQWNFRITAYADRLIEDLQGLEWPEGILSMQRNWIGKQKGLNIDFSIEGSDTKLTVWTKFWETIFGVTFIVVAPEHPWVQQLISSTPLRQGSEGASAHNIALTDVKSYVSTAMAKTDEQRMKEEKDKTGVFTGHYAINPVNGEKIPVWIADYVLSTVGTGAVMGVPSHDERDFAFAKKYDLPLKQVVSYDDKSIDAKVAAGEMSFEGEGKLINSGEFSGQIATEGKKKMADWMIEQKIAEWKVSYHLRDWIFSRQRYWGEPIPMVYCESCAAEKKTWWDTAEGKTFVENTGTQKLADEVVHNISDNVKTIQNNQYGWFPIDQKSLPLELPYTESYEPSGTGESPLAAMKDWTKATCPVCGKEAKRETDTMPNWAGSCWYFLRFADPKNDAEPWSAESMKQWSPVDWYVGGAEHAVLHLLYSRFWVKALYDLKMLDFKEPFLRLRNVGMVLATDHRKMSKSFGNVINPDDVVNEFGADTLRVYEMFMAPFNQEISWSTEALQGSNRFLIRIWNLFHEQFGKGGNLPAGRQVQETGSRIKSVMTKHHDDPTSSTTHKVGTSLGASKKVAAKLNQTIEKVSRDITSVKYNTAIAAMMEFLNEYEKTPHLSVENAKKFLQILAPFAPFMTDYIWRNLMGEKSSIHISNWPTVDETAVHLTEITIPVQVNGKLRAVITIPAHDIEKDKVVRHAEEHEVIKRYIAGKIYEPVYVRAKVLNFVLKD